MNILKEWFLGSWNSQCVLYEYEVINLIVYDEQYLRVYKFEDCAPIIKFIMFLVFLGSNVIFGFLHIFKYFLFTLWISPKSELGIIIKQNKEILELKQDVPGDYY